MTIYDIEENSLLPPVMQPLSNNLGEEAGVLKLKQSGNASIVTSLINSWQRTAILFFPASQSYAMKTTKKSLLHSFLLGRILPCHQIKL